MNNVAQHHPTEGRILHCCRLVSSTCMSMKMAKMSNGDILKTGGLYRFLTGQRDFDKVPDKQRCTHNVKGVPKLRMWLSCQFKVTYSFKMRSITERTSMV